MQKKDVRAVAGSWGQAKRRVNIMLTPDAIAIIDAIATDKELTRSEALERLIRSTTSMNT